ncbi:serine arginine-rich splicing factor 4-like isoform X14, partial [Clarias magur]
LHPGESRSEGTYVNGGTRPSSTAYPMSTARFQRKVFAMLFDLKEELRRVAAIVDPGNSSSSIKRLDSERDLRSFEESIKDEEKKSICVQQLSRVGGSSVRDCVNKVMN